MAKKVAIENICSLMFYGCFIMFFIKVKKHVFMFFISKSMFLTSMAQTASRLTRFTINILLNSLWRNRKSSPLGSLK